MGTRKSKKKEKEEFKVEKFYILNLKIRNVESPDDIDAGTYASLFREFYLSETRSKSSKVKEGMLITLAEQPMTNVPSFYYGQFVEFTNLDNTRWFDILKKEIDNSFSVPDNYKANVHQTQYYFFPTIHRFAYSVTSKNSINPYNAREFLKNSFQEFLDKKHPTEYLVQIDVETKSEAVQKILNAKVIYSLNIKINYSNAGFGKQSIEFVENDIKPTNLGEIDINVKSKKGGNIDISKSKILKGSLGLTQSNGTATAVIENNQGKRETIKTKDHPNKVIVNVSKANPSKSIFNYFLKMFNHVNH